MDAVLAILQIAAAAFWVFLMVRCINRGKVPWQPILDAVFLISVATAIGFGMVALWAYQ
jgi:hypothetical protein